MPCCQCLQLAHRIIRPSSCNSNVAINKSIDNQSFCVNHFYSGTVDNNSEHRQVMNIVKGAVAQRLERATDNRVVTGSNPTQRPFGNLGKFLYPT